MAPFVNEDISTSPSISLDFSKVQKTPAKAEVFGLETSALLNIHLEDMAFSSQVAEVENWWSSPRFAGIQRPYTAEQICGARGNLTVPYASDTLSKKLWCLLEKRAKVSLIQFIVMAVPHYIYYLKVTTAHANATDSNDKCHLWVHGPCPGHADGQGPRHCLCIRLAVLCYCVVFKRAVSGPS